MSDVVGGCPEGALNAHILAIELEALLAHVGRAAPQRLDACFSEMRLEATLPRLAVPPFPPGVAAPVTGEPTGPRMQAFMAAIVEVIRKATTRDAWTPEELAFVLQARSFLAQLVAPTTIDSILVTEGYHRGIPWFSQFPGPLRRLLRTAERGLRWLLHPLVERQAPPREPVPDPRAWREAHPSRASGWRFAGTARSVRGWAVNITVLTLVAALYVFAGRTLQESVAQQLAALGTLQAQIELDIAVTRNQPGQAAAAPTNFDERHFAHDPSLAYCDQPFFDDEGIIHYANARQELNCNRLWGINRAVNQANRQMQLWIMPMMLPPMRWVFGLFDDGTAARRPDEDLGSGGRSGALRLFAENARPISLNEAYGLVVQRRCVHAMRLAAASGQSEADDAPATPPGAPPSEAVRAAAKHCRLAGPQGNFDQVIQEGLGLYNVAFDRFHRLGYSLRANAEGQNTSPIRARIVIDGLSIYLLPVLFALLGAYVAVLRGFRRRADAAELSLTEQTRVRITIVLGACFGAVVSLIAVILGNKSDALAATANVPVGFWPLAFLAGYAVSDVFRALDAAVARIFGNAPSPAEASVRRD